MPGTRTKTKEKPEKFATTIWLGPKASEMLRVEAAITRVPMSVIVERLIEERFGRKRKARAPTGTG